MNTARAFLQQPRSEGITWAGKCLLLSTLIGFGWISGNLQTVSIVVIASFVALQGILPFLLFTRRLSQDCWKCREEKKLLQNIDAKGAAQLANIDKQEAGSIVRLLTAVQINLGRISKVKAADLFLEVADQDWRDQITPIANGAEQAPLLGLGGSLLGILGTLSALGGKEASESALLDSMATMLSTTLVGCAGSFLLIGLSSLASAAVNRHMAELRMFASLMVGDEEEVEGQFESLFH